MVFYIHRPTYFLLQLNPHSSVFIFYSYSFLTISFLGLRFFEALGCFAVIRPTRFSKNVLDQQRWDECERGVGANVWPPRLRVFGSTSTISRFGERFRDGQYSLVIAVSCFLFFYTHGAPVPGHL